jgi:ABC-type sulfate transport system permease component
VTDPQYYEPYGSGYGTYTEPVPDYRTWAIAAVIGGIFFSLIIGTPLALVALRKSRRVRQLQSVGNQQEAVRASRSARSWALAATIVECLSALLLVYLIR